MVTLHALTASKSFVTSYSSYKASFWFDSSSLLSSEFRSRSKKLLRFSITHFHRGILLFWITIVEYTIILFGVLNVHFVTSYSWNKSIDKNVRWLIIFLYNFFKHYLEYIHLHLDHLDQIYSYHAGLCWDRKI